jgi:hypothetical protein
MTHHVHFSFFHPKARYQTLNFSYRFLHEMTTSFLRGWDGPTRSKRRQNQPFDQPLSHHRSNKVGLIFKQSRQSKNLTLWPAFVCLVFTILFVRFCVLFVCLRPCDSELCACGLPRLVFSFAIWEEVAVWMGTRLSLNERKSAILIRHIPCIMLFHFLLIAKHPLTSTPGMIHVSR